VNGVNGMAAHGSVATAENCTTVVGISRPGTDGAIAGTGAVTVGRTFTAVGGVGSGSAYAGAQQFGMGTVTSTANVAGNATGQVVATSTVATGTFSTASLDGAGSAVSGSMGGAANVSYALAGSNAIPGGVSVRTEGMTAGVDGVKTFSNSVVGNATVDAGGTLTVGETTGVGSFQSGSFSANIVRNFTVTTNGVGGPSGCVGGSSSCGNGGGDDGGDGGDKPKGPKGNNGYGNGDQGAPGNSGGNNNAENGSQGGNGSNGKPRKPN